MLSIRDVLERKTALDPSRSFIVQAPAGSGKTSILVQRYLALLAYVNSPEEILAITFTRKAAFEMRSRIIAALKKAHDHETSSDEFSKTTQEFAKRALTQDNVKKWHVLENPSRLRIQTIDSFCHYLVNQAPLISKIKPDFKLVQDLDAENYYRKAAKEILANIDDKIYSEHLQRLMLHIDNDWQRAENLFVTMLKSRDQWLVHIVNIENTQKLRQKMEQVLQDIAHENIECVSSLFPRELHHELNTLIAFSRSNIENPEVHYEEIEINEIFIKKDLQTGQKIASFLLTKEYSWRKKVTKEHGFPVPDKEYSQEQKKLLREMKDRMHSLLNQLSSHEELRQSLANLIVSPPPHYEDQQWEMAKSLLSLLPLLVAHLKVLFDENKVADYTEISMAALQALGAQEQPTELALNLDYRLQHLLIDEFQDISISQYRMIENLITTWQQNDGRTIFMVGDPMQSIYRFREAEVGLFLRVKHEGIGALKPEPITLTTNFRSAPTIVDWLNQHFPKILPKISDIGFGAVPYIPSSAIVTNQNAAVQLSILKNNTQDEEATNVVSQVKQIQTTYPDDTIAILVKSRRHLRKVIPKLRSANINYQALELETLEENMAIQDILALTYAIFDLTNRIAWLGILRAPWCGLTLNDLYKIANGSDKTIWYNICNYQNLSLSVDGAARLKKIKSILATAINLSGRMPHRELIEKTWLALGGPTTLSDKAELEYVQTYLELLENPALDIGDLQKKLRTLYPHTDVNAKLQIMTIHRAKGLEFDHVIVPGINQATGADEHKLMLWFERPNLHKGTGLILAPIEASGNHNDPIYQYLRLVEKRRSFYETGRLLYVAMTRAKKTLSMFGVIKQNKKDSDIANSIQSNSLLEQLSPCFDSSWVKENQTSVAPKNIDQLEQPKIYRLNINWQSPVIANFPVADHTPIPQPDDNQSAIMGTAIHICLRQLSESNLDIWTPSHIKSMQSHWTKLLQQLGYLEISRGLKLIDKAISSTLNDKRGRWILDKHKQAESELKLTTTINNKVENYVIDRTFVDQDKVRWVIDYKTSEPITTDIDTFLKQESEKHAKQLANYARIMADFASDKTEIRLGLYFPLFSGWIELSD